MFFKKNPGKTMDMMMLVLAIIHLAWLAITLSFGFYIPVVLWADVSPMIGMLMLPKSICYVWLVTMGLKAAK